MFTWSSKIARAAGAKLMSIFDMEASGRLLLYSVIVGIVAGLGATAFAVLLDLTDEWVMGDLVGYQAPPTAESKKPSEEQIEEMPVIDAAQSAKSEVFKPSNLVDTEVEEVKLPERPWMIVIVATIGGLICGALVYGFAPEAEGHGTDGMIRAFHQNKGIIRGRVPIVKSIASIITIGTGGSAGREGPIAQIGAGFGSVMSLWLKLSERERRLLVLAGAAGGVGAIFRAPLGGALFAVEVLYAGTAFEFSALIPCVCASVTAYNVYESLSGHGFEHHFALFSGVSDLGFHGPHEIPFYLVFAVLCALVGFVYVFVFYQLRDRIFKLLTIPNWIKPGIGGLLLGLLAMNKPEIMSGGYGWIQMAIDGKLLVEVMAILVVLKILATSFTISSGGSGGVFAPSLFIGAMLGGAFGFGCQKIFGASTIIQPEAFVLVGMAGFFAGVAKVPLTALVMVSEMSGSYNLFVPLMIVSMLNVAILSRRISLYEEQVPSLVDSPAHLGDFIIDVLEDIKVRQVYQPSRRPTFICQNLPLRQVLERVAESTATYFPVVDDDEQLVGVFSLSDIRSTLVGPEMSSLVVAADIAFPVPTVTADDDLLTVLRICTEKQLAEIPVVRTDDPTHVVCMLRRGEVLAAYDERMSELRQMGKH